MEMGTFEATESTDDKTSDSPIRSITSAYPPTEESTIGTDSQQNEQTSGKTESFSRFGTTAVHPSEGRTTLFITHDKTNGLTNDRTFTTEASPTMEMGTFEATESTEYKTSNSPIRSITSVYPPTLESTIGTDSQQNEQTSGKTESFSRFGTTEVLPSEVLSNHLTTDGTEEYTGIYGTFVFTSNDETTPESNTESTTVSNMNEPPWEATGRGMTVPVTSRNVEQTSVSLNIPKTTLMSGKKTVETTGFYTKSTSLYPDISSPLVATIADVSPSRQYDIRSTPPDNNFETTTSRAHHTPSHTQDSNTTGEKSTTSTYPNRSSNSRVTENLFTTWERSTQLHLQTVSGTVVNKEYTTQDYFSTSYQSTAEQVSCPMGLGSCQDGSCIPEEYFCDLWPGDCPDFYDESVAAGCPPCNESTEYRCPEGLCIPQSYLCDAYPYDCANNFDESDEMCEGTCRGIEAPVNGVEVGTFKYFYKSGEKAEFACLSGYTLVGTDTLYCQNGTFNSSVPTCHVNCPPPQHPVYGDYSGSLNHGESIVFTCDDGYVVTPSSSKIIYCQDGSLNDTIPTCEELDECTSSPCLNGGICIDSINSYLCACTEHWMGTLCTQDVNECFNTSLNLCDENADCYNTNGSYSCACKDGYKGSGFVCREDFFFPYGDSFTENGVILFLRENEDKYGFPHPYEGGFTSAATDRIVAPFWADADMTQGIGEVFYQVYDSNSTNFTSTKEAVLTEASTRIRDYDLTLLSDSNVTFEANWMLLVTWRNVSAYTSEYLADYPNTFQAALMTDGIFSFVIFNYMEDEMLWNTDLLYYKDAIIGYGDGNGTYDNTHLQSPFTSVTSRYRPDQLVGNTNLQGRWYFRLENNTVDTLNHKQQCLDWYHRQPDPSTWSRTLGTCPCGFQQGRSDNTYSRSRSAELNQVDPVYTTTRRFDEELLEAISGMEGEPFCIQTTLSNEFGAGMKCCYRDDHSLIEGYQTLWRSSFVQRHQFIYGTYIDEVKRQDWIDEDLVPRYDCCVASQDPSFCALYEEKRPAGSCDGYLPPQTGWMFGDPHMETLDKYPYTFNGLGEFTLVDINNGQFVLQGRMERALTETDIANGTVFTGFAGKLQNSTLIEIYLNEDRTDFEVTVNSSIKVNRTDLMSVPFYSDADPNFYMEVDQDNFTNANGSDRLVVYWVYGVSISVAMSTPGMLDVFFEVPNKFKGNSTKGLFGVWNDDMMDDFLMSNGSTLDTHGRSNLTDREVFTFGQSWRVPPEKSLFSYKDGMTWNDYNDVEFIPSFLDELIGSYENQTLYSLASEVCGTDIQCLFDSLAMRDVSIGLSTKRTGFVLQDDAQWLANFPPNITEGETLLLAEVGVESQMRIKAYDIDGDTISFSQQYPISNSTLQQISSTVAVFTWTPVDKEPVQIGIVASDGRSTSLLVTDVIICSCLNGGTCDYENLVDSSALLEDHFAVATCLCPPAWTGDDCSEDYDACLDNPCFPGVTCKDEIAPEANATCGQCPTGLDGNGFKCYDTDECLEAQFNTSCEQLCVNTIGSFSCDCFHGYRLHPSGRTCIDEDECDSGANDCDPEFAICLNLPGSYNCTCLDGFDNVYNNGSSCEDFNECREDQSVCHPQSICTNIIGSYSCQCRDGFEGNGVTCEDCTNTQGSYICECPEGYEGNGIICLDTDECSDGSATCSGGFSSECLNAVGSYTCRCLEGYEDVNGSCHDTNECKDSPCAEEAVCTNSNGSFTCSCGEGFMGNGYSCENIDECTLQSDNCTQVCNDVSPGFICGCYDNFELQPDGVTCTAGTSCANENLCVNGQCYYDDSTEEDTCVCLAGYQLSPSNATICQARNSCDADIGVCNNTSPGYTCSCKAGYTLAEDERTCQDIDECESSPCSVFADCTNTPGSYLCECQLGYYGNGSSCEDINECEVGESTCYSNGTCVLEPVSCDQNAHCINTNGSFECSCNAGYRGTGLECVDINECFEEYCHSNADCINLEGSVNCTCFAGYHGDGISSCLDINECLDHTVCNAMADCTNTNGSYICMCPDGYRGSGVNNCTNINECQENLDDCDMRASCVDTDGSYNCTCGDGYTGNGTTCENIDECLIGTNDCDEFAECEDLDGSYTCRCMEGYFSDIIAREGTCYDIDECSYGLADCDDSSRASCTNTEGSFICQCKDGFMGDGYNCTDIDECASTIPCPTEENQKCSNVYGSYDCICMTGYYKINNTCSVSKSFTMMVIFTDIKGWNVNSLFDLYNLSQISIELGQDDNIYSWRLSGMQCGRIYQCVYGVNVEFRVDLIVNTEYVLADVEEAFDSGLTGRNKDFVEPDSRVLKVSVNVTLPLIDPCAEGTHHCFERGFTKCVFTSNNSFACQDCKSGYQQLNGSCEDINECLQNPCDYLGEAICVNTAGSYRVMQWYGYMLIEGICSAALKFRGQLLITEVNATQISVQTVNIDINEDSYDSYATTVCSVVSYNLLTAAHIAPSYMACEVLGFRSVDGGEVAYFSIGLNPTTNITEDVLVQTLADSSDEDGRLYSEREGESITINTTSIVFQGFNKPITQGLGSNVDCKNKQLNLNSLKHGQTK
ncbi:putative fibrillin-1 [Apostichopus japonicus]|uniref:Putative fibrillin-1 n=1 Tax=Stichopus japonicus TaxID=307972 RepID=A0A2G8KE99_STIJA|nr:putative fibrillin-1 [Apostichopus japonicus]